MTHIAWCLVGRPIHGSDWSKWLGTTNNIGKHSDELCGHVERCVCRFTEGWNSSQCV